MSVDNGMLSAPMPDFPSPLSSLGVVTVQRDGRWYVAPTRSVLGLVVTGLEGIQKDDVQHMRNWIKEWFGGDCCTGSSSFSSVGTPIDGSSSSSGTDVTNDPTGGLPPQMTAQMKAMKQCAATDGGGTGTDPSPGTGFRLDYLIQKRMGDCLQKQVDEGKIPQSVVDQMDRSLGPCFGPYEALTPNATEEQWKAADAQVEACMNRQSFGSTSSSSGTASSTESTVVTAGN
jgi:hypothetical protein